MISKIVFTYVKGEVGFNNIENFNFDIIFSDKKYSKNCILIEDLNLFNCINYLSNLDNNIFCYINSKSYIKENDLTYFLNSNELYLNYFNNNIYFLKYDKLFSYFFNLFRTEINNNNLFKFIYNYFSTYDGNINKNLCGKIVFPKNKFIYNMSNEKLKHKKNNC